MKKERKEPKVWVAVSKVTPYKEVDSNNSIDILRKRNKANKVWFRCVR